MDSPKVYIDDFDGKQSMVFFRKNYRPAVILDKDGNTTEWKAAPSNYYYGVKNKDNKFKYFYYDHEGLSYLEMTSKGNRRSEIGEDWRGSSYIRDSEYRVTHTYEMNLDQTVFGGWTDGTNRVYGGQGYILCAWSPNENWDDLISLPSYISSYQKKDTVQCNDGYTTDPRALRHPSQTTCTTSGWNPVAGKRDFTVTLNFYSNTPCDITIYSWLSIMLNSINPGREFDIQVTDGNGQKNLYIHNNTNSIYCRFTVKPDNDNKVVLKFIGSPTLWGDMQPSVSGIFFDTPDTHLIPSFQNINNRLQ